MCWIPSFRGTRIVGEIRFPSSESAEVLASCGSWLYLTIFGGWRREGEEGMQKRNFDVRVHNKNPYHNNIHATDVLLGTNYLLCASGIIQYLSVIHYWYVWFYCSLMLFWRKKRHLSNNEFFAALFAALIHDLGHPGFNNAFLIQTGLSLFSFPSFPFNVLITPLSPSSPSLPPSPALSHPPSLPPSPLSPSSPFRSRSCRDAQW